MTSSLAMCVTELEDLSILTYKPGSVRSWSTLNLFTGGTWALTDVFGQKEELGVDQTKIGVLTVALSQG